MYSAENELRFYSRSRKCVEESESHRVVYAVYTYTGSHNDDDDDGVNRDKNKKYVTC